MTPESSPFTPGQPVPIEYFVGRIAEIERLRAMVRAALQGRFRIGFVTGERGIGKSSLASFLRHLCEREDSVAGAHVFLGGVTELAEMVRRTFDRILKESIDKPWHQKVRELFGKYVRQVGLFGISVELQPPSEELSTVVNGFVPALRQVVSRLNGEHSALLLILDDINGLASSPQFANWLKSVVDEIATSDQPLRVCMLVVGLEERRQALVAHQPSLARVFELVQIRPWSREESLEFFRKAFTTASATVDENGLQMMVHFAGGLPVLAHEIGDAVWRAAQDKHITQDDVRQGVIDAAEVIGHKLVEPQIFQAIRSKRYRSILRKLAVSPFGFSFQRAELRARLAEEETKVLDNFLKRMKQLGAIVSDGEAGPGGYRFANQLQFLYFWMESQRARGEKAS